MRLHIVEWSGRCEAFKKIGMLKQHKNHQRQKMKGLTYDILPEQRIVLYDMRSRNTTTLQVYENNGNLKIAFKAPTNVRIAKE